MGKLLSIMDTGKPKSAVQSLMDSLTGAMVDWNIVLRMGNSWYDRMAAACREPTRTARRKAVDGIGHDLRKLATTSLGLSMFFNPSRAFSERTGRSFVFLLLPSTDACLNAEDRAAMQFELTKLAFTLAAYRAERGSYPAKLAELAPKYVPAVPKDIFNEADLHYRREATGYLLYSVGENGVDDGGNDREDAKGDENWDDQVIRMPQ
jgi:hypothetical protein